MELRWPAARSPLVEPQKLPPRYIRRIQTELGSEVVIYGSGQCELEALTPHVKVVNGFQVSNRGTFGTARAKVAVAGGGKWFYEVKLGSNKMQLQLQPTKRTQHSSPDSSQE